MEALLLIAAVLLALYLLQAFLYDRLWSRGLSAKLSFREEYATEDEQAALLEVIVNDKFLPLPVLEVNFHMDRGLRFSDEDNTAVSDYSYRRDVFALGVRQKITRTLDFKCARRGYYQIGSAGMTAQNLLLTKKYVTDLPQHTEFYVLPRPVAAERIQIPFSRVMGSVVNRKKQFDDPFEFAGLRSYTRTDPMKYINWKASAKAGELLVNMHESTLSQKVLVLLDMEGLGVLQADVLNEEAVRIACSLCVRLLTMGVEVEAASNGTDALTGKGFRIPGVSGAGSVLALRKRFACVQAGNGLPPITGLLPREAGGTLCVLVSRDQKEDTALALSAWAGKRDCVQIIPYRDSHAELPVPGNVQRIYWQA